MTEDDKVLEISRILTEWNPLGARAATVEDFNDYETEARVVINQWLAEYNTVRPHGSLEGMNPERFLYRWKERNTNHQPKTLTLGVV